MLMFTILEEVWRLSDWLSGIDNLHIQGWRNLLKHKNAGYECATDVNK